MDILSRRMAWTRIWLNKRQQPPEPEDRFEIVSRDLNEDSDYGIQSLSEHDSVAKPPGNNVALPSPHSNSVPNDFPSTSNPPDHADDLNPFISSQRGFENCSHRGSHCDHCDWQIFCSVCHWQWHRTCLEHSGPQAIYMSAFIEWYLDYAEELEVVPKTEAINYEIAGRSIENTFRDLRSPKKARRRRRTEREKYFFYQAVKPGWLNAEHYEHDGYRMTSPLSSPRELVADSKIVIMTKKMMYQEAQLYPRPPTYSRRRNPKIHWMCTMQATKSRKERKHTKQVFAEECNFAETLNRIDCGSHQEIDFVSLKWDDDWTQMLRRRAACVDCRNSVKECRL